MQFRMTSIAPTDVGAVAWWVSTDPAGIGHPMVFIERRMSPTMSEQVALTDRGIRIFRYEKNRPVTASAPLVGPDSIPDPTILRTAIRHYTASASSGHNAPQIPPQQIATIETTEDVRVLLRGYWSELKKDPPDGMTYRHLDAEIQLSRHSLTELLDIQESM
jgi:hypothetical protein